MEKARSRRGWLGLMLCAAVMAVVMLLPAKAAKAANMPLACNDQWVTGNIADKDEIHVYEIALPSAGYLTVTYQGHSIYDSYYQLMNADQTKEYWKHEVWYSYSTSPKTNTSEKWMSPGTYLVKVWSSGNNTGDYRLKASFAPANNTETEPNDAFASAMPLSPGEAGKVLGVLTEDDGEDFYSFYLPSTKKVKITYTSMIYDSYMEVWNQDFIQKKSQNVYYCSETAPKTHTYEETLTAGTWYVKIRRDTGRYYLSWEEVQEIVLASTISVSGGREMKVGEEVTLYANVLPTNVTNGAVDWSSDNTSVATVDSNGKVTARAAGRAVITARAKDGSNVSGSYTLTVKEKVVGVPVKTIKVKGKSVVLAGKKATFKATVSPSKATNKKVTWTSSNKSLATVSASGVVKAKRPGKVVITATAKDGSRVSGSYTMVIRPKKVNFKKAYSNTYRTIYLNWKKQSNVSGYQVQWCRNSSFSGTRSGTLGGAATGGKITGVPSGSRWYIRVRSYVWAGSTKYYGAWSKTRAVRAR